MNAALNAACYRKRGLVAVGELRQVRLVIRNARSTRQRASTRFAAHYALQIMVVPLRRGRSSANEAALKANV